MIRRFNYTKRRKIPHSAFDITLEPSAKRSFNAKFELEPGLFPANARLYFEASTSGSSAILRFGWGTVGNPTPPADRSLAALPGSNAVFTFKVVDESQTVGRILGIAKGIALRGGGLNAGTSRESLLPVNPVALGSQVWRISFASETPWLEVNQDLPDIMNRVQSDPLFLSLVYPEIVRAILTEALIVRDMDNPEDTESWEGRWLSFACRFHPESEFPPSPGDDPDTMQRRGWIEAVVEHFARHFEMKERFLAVPYSGLEA